MRTHKLVFAAAAALTMMSAYGKPKTSDDNSPKLRKGEFISKTSKRTSVSDEISDYAKNISDPEDNSFFLKKYTQQSQAAWQCHDPKLFQDDDGTYYVYSTGWQQGVEIRSSKDLIHWTKHSNSALWGQKDSSIKYHNMNWDDDFLKWVGYDTNDATRYGNQVYTSNGTPNSWAPTVVKQNGKYYMFHGIITDCLPGTDAKIHPAACITLAISDSPIGPFIPAATYNPELYKTSSLVRYVWSQSNYGHSLIGYDKCYNTGNEGWSNGFGAIDPEFVFDIATGKLMEYTIGSNKCYAMTYGSWKGGVVLVYVDAETFKPVNQKTGEEMDSPLDSIPGNSGLLIAGGQGAAYEGAQLIYNSETGFYYIFVSMGDLSIEYRVGVGRSEKIEGPYIDTKKLPMKNPMGYHGTGAKIIGAYQMEGDYGFKSPGGQSILRSADGKILFACHTRFNEMPNHLFALQIHQMFFNKEGWPLLNWNEYGGEEKNPEQISMEKLKGTYNAVLTRRSSDPSEDQTATLSKKIEIDADGNISGGYKGKVRIDEDGATFELENLGVFYGFAMDAINFAKKPMLSMNDGKTVTFCALNSLGTKAAKEAKGEYFFGNKIN